MLLISHYPQWYFLTTIPPLRASEAWLLGLLDSIMMAVALQPRQCATDGIRAK